MLNDVMIYFLTVSLATAMFAVWCIHLHSRKRARYRLERRLSAAFSRAKTTRLHGATTAESRVYSSVPSNLAER